MGGARSGIGLRRMLVAGCLAASCASVLPRVPPDATRLRPDVFVQPLAPGVWRHVSIREDGIASNGLVIASPDGPIVVDTAWNPEQTGVLLDWVAADLGPVAGVLVTHAHDDRLGGLAALEARGIPSYSQATLLSNNERLEVVDALTIRLVKVWDERKDHAPRLPNDWRMRGLHRLRSGDSIP